MISDDQLKQIMPNLQAARRQLYLPALNQAMQTHGVDTMLRTAAFIAQLAHESGEFRFMEEIWGPTPAQVRYEPPSDLAKRLGNTEPGDGKRFKGRGPIQITGRFNYQKYGGLLGVDLVANPPIAATPDVAFATAGLYWQRNGLNELADQEQFTTITRRINGGTNGLEDRKKYYARAKAVLATGFEAGPAAAVTRSAKKGPPVEGDALARGDESIRVVARRLAREGAAPAQTEAARKAAPARKAVVKKTAAKKTAAKKVAAKKAPGKKAPARKPAKG